MRECHAEQSIRRYRYSVEQKESNQVYTKVYNIAYKKGYFYVYNEDKCDWYHIDKLEFVGNTNITPKRRTT